MKPYFQSGDATIYHADCREIMPDLSWDVVITDPPFNVGYGYNSYKDRLKESDYDDLIREACVMPSAIVHYPEAQFDIANALLTKPSRCVAWVYNSNTARQHRTIAWYGTKPDFRKVSQPYKNPTDKRILARIEAGKTAKLYDWWNINQVKNVSKASQPTSHPCQMPLEVMLRVVGITEGQTILDPFMGSGTTLMAANHLGRESIGIDMDEAYCELAAERLQQLIQGELDL